MSEIAQLTSQISLFLPPEFSFNILGGTILKAEVAKELGGEVDSKGGDDLGEDEDAKEANDANGGDAIDVVDGEDVAGACKLLS